MAVGATATEEPYPVPGDGRRWLGQAFGLAVDAPAPLVGLESANAAGDRRARFDVTTPSDLDSRWRAEEAEFLFRQPLPNGRSALTLERHDTLGFRMFAHRYGHWIIDHDGSSILAAAPDDLERWLWERFLVGQVLPFVALLRGLEVFHASAVVADERVLAIVGGSGVGKTSVGLNLVLLGLPFFTDDVLALEAGGESLVCQPGAGAANVRDGALWAEFERAEETPGEIVGRGSDSLRVRLERDERPLPPGAVYFLDRASTEAAPRFEPMADPYLLLASTFNFVLRTPERLESQLDSCARLAKSAALFRVVSPRSSTAVELAAAIVDHARS
jgi:hypothetical protein